MPAIIFPKPLWTGKQIMSLIIPEDINLVTSQEETNPIKLENDIDLLSNLKDNVVRIRKGELVSGVTGKALVGSAQ